MRPLRPPKAKLSDSFMVPQFFLSRPSLRPAESANNDIRSDLAHGNAPRARAVRSSEMSFLRKTAACVQAARCAFPPAKGLVPVPGRTTRRQVSWLAGRRFRTAFPGKLPVARMAENYRLTVAGTAPDFHRVPSWSPLRGHRLGMGIGGKRRVVNEAIEGRVFADCVEEAGV